jgi:nucleoside-diphosphate-sugar epimerase
MKILVTGGLGLIGHNVVARLESLGHKVVIIDNQTNYGIIPRPELDYLLAERRKKIQKASHYRYNIADKLNIDYLFTFERFDMVIHMASFPRQKVVNADPAGGARVMMEGLINLLEASKRTGVKKFMYISSSMVYGDFVDDVTEDAVCCPQGQYGIMKLAGEHLVKDYARRDCFSYTVIRPSAVYGPLDVEDRVVSKFMLAAMQGRVLRINGERETLDFTYVDDAADGIVAAALSGNTANKTYNITKSHSVTLVQAAQMAVELAGSGEIQVGDRDLDFPSRGALNIDAARQDFGYDPQVDVAEGFARYHKWFLESEYWQGRLNADRV